LYGAASWCDVAQSASVRQAVTHVKLQRSIPVGGGNRVEIMFLHFRYTSSWASLLMTRIRFFR
jgi:hypothetical protein